MANTFHIASVNPIPFRELVELAPIYNTFPLDLQPGDKDQYYQPWQTNDTTKIQVLSDFEFTVSVKDRYTNNVKITIVPIEVTSIIVDQSFKVYEFDVNFAAIGIGYYYIDIDVEDGRTFRSQTMAVQTVWPDSLLIQYKNSFNDFSVDFSTGILFTHRFHGLFSDYKPSFDDSIYIDQEYNPLQQDSVTYDVFTLTAKKCPNWELKLLNEILNCDTKRIDSQFYEKTEGANWDVTRENDIAVQASMEMVQVKDFFLQQIIPGDDMATGDYFLNHVTERYIDNAANITITGKFKRNSQLVRIVFVNTGGDDITLNVGTTNGGSQIGSFDIEATDLTGTLKVEYTFDSSQTVYLTGLAGSLMNIFVDWIQLDADPVNINGTGSGSFRYPKGANGMWSPIDSGDLNTYWDLASGLGKTGTKYENCAIRDGRNGTTNDLGKYDVGVSTLDDLATLLNTTVGANTRVLTVNNIPAHTHLVVNGDTSGTPLSGNNKIASQKDNGVNRDYLLSGTGTAADRGQTSSTGSGEAFDNRPLSRIKLPFIAITD